jgi:hypothetical protein
LEFYLFLLLSRTVSSLVGRVTTPKRILCKNLFVRSSVAERDTTRVLMNLPPEYFIAHRRTEVLSCWPSPRPKSDVHIHQHSLLQISRHPATPFWFDRTSERSKIPRSIIKLSESGSAAASIWFLAYAEQPETIPRASGRLLSTAKYPVIL